MHDMKPKQSSDATGGSGAASGKSGQDYKSRLDAILAKAGNNNPIARAQAKAQPPSGQAPQPAAGQPVTAMPAIPQAPAPAPAQPQDPNQRLQQILAMAGQTPAQRAQAQAQQKSQQTSQQAVAAFLSGCQAYFAALAQDATKMMRMEAEFGGVGNTDDYYLRCYADAKGGAFWDLSGEDIDYQLQNTPIAQYALYDNYYRGIPDAVMRQAVGSAKQVSCHVV